MINNINPGDLLSYTKECLTNRFLVFVVANYKTENDSSLFGTYVMCPNINGNSWIGWTHTFSLQINYEKIL